MADGKKYYRLGSTATSFHDPKSGLNIAGDEVAEVDAAAARRSKTVRNAVDGGHIIEADAADYKAAKEKAPNQDIGEKGGPQKTGTGKANKIDNPNAFKSGSTSPNGMAPGAGGQGGSMVSTADEDEEDDVEQEDDPVKAAPKKKKTKKDKTKSKK